MFFRRGVSDDDWLEVKLWLFAAGALLALLGMGFRNDWLIGAAAIVLGAGIALRFIDRRPAEEGTEAAADEAAEADSPPDPGAP